MRKPPRSFFLDFISCNLLFSLMECPGLCRYIDQPPVHSLGEKYTYVLTFDCHIGNLYFLSR